MVGFSLQSSYFEKLPAILDAPWSVAESDLIYPETTGTRPDAFDQRLRFAAALQRLAVQEPDIQRLVTEVRHLLKPPSVYRDAALQKRVAAVIAEMSG